MTYLVALLEKLERTMDRSEDKAERHYRVIEILLTEIRDELRKIRERQP